MADEERRRKRDKLISTYKFTETRAIIVPTNNFPMAKNKASVGRTRIKQKQGKKGGRVVVVPLRPFIFGRTVQAEQFSRDGRAVIRPLNPRAHTGMA